MTAWQRQTQQVLNLKLEPKPIEIDKIQVQIDKKAHIRNSKEIPCPTKSPSNMDIRGKGLAGMLHPLILYPVLTFLPTKMVMKVSIKPQAYKIKDHAALIVIKPDIPVVMEKIIHLILYIRRGGSKVSTLFPPLSVLPPTVTIRNGKIQTSKGAESHRLGHLTRLGLGKDRGTPSKGLLTQMNRGTLLLVGKAHITSGVRLHSQGSTILERLHHILANIQGMLTFQRKIDF
mmetsp:Transcript_14449/g.18954  ORF Transcript_14449/g.18954 Transcript_14449/m.18954 type:complete len:231 (-) Transcript_14449:2188-2880(-)